MFAPSNEWGGLGQLVASPLPSAAHEALRRATTPRGWPRRRCIYFKKQTKCKKEARAAARRYSTRLQGA